MPLIEGIIAATFTPMHADGSLHLEQVEAITDHLIESGVQGLYVCGSTGEGPSLTTEERMHTAEAYVRAARGRIPVVIQVGHNSIEDSRALAGHAKDIGADAVSALSPNYFKPADIETLIDILVHAQEPAAGLPFYYYHIPAFTGVPVNVAELLPRLKERMPNLAGAKFTSPAIHEFLTVDRSRFEVLFGVDEMLFAGLASGAQGAVGSTYNLFGGLARRIQDAVQRGAMDEGRDLQVTYTKHIDALIEPRGLPAIKAALRFSGLKAGQVRLPMKALSATELEVQEQRLSASGTLDVIRNG